MRGRAKRHCRGEALAKHRCELTPWREPSNVDLLAKARWATSDFAPANFLEKKVLGAHGGIGRIPAQMEDHPHLYEDKKPYRIDTAQFTENLLNSDFITKKSPGK